MPRPKKGPGRRKKKFDTRTKHSSIEKKVREKIRYLNSKNQQHIIHLSNQHHEQVISNQLLQNENYSLLNEITEHQQPILPNIDDDNYSETKEYYNDHQDKHEIGKNFKTLLLCFSMRVIDGTPITNIVQSIERFSKYSKLKYTPVIWKSATIAKYFKYRLLILNIIHLSFILITNIKFFKNVNLGFDGTTKQQRSYQHLRISGARDQDITPESLTIGYIRLYATSSEADCHGIKRAVIRLNSFINIWYNKQQLLQSNGFEQLNFKCIDERITNLRFDRSIVNFATATKLNQDKNLRFNITNDKIFNCTRHDINNVILKLEEEMKSRRNSDLLNSYDHCVGICAFFIRLVKPTSDLAYNKINQFQSFINKYHKNQFQNIQKVIRKTKYARGSRRVDLWQNVVLFNIIDKFVIEFLTFNYDSKRVVSQIQYEQFQLLCNNTIMIKERYITSFIENIFVKPFFGSIKQQSMKLVSPIMCSIIDVFEKINNDDSETKVLILLCVFGIKPLINEWTKLHNEHLYMIIGYEYKYSYSLTWINSYLGIIFFLYIIIIFVGEININDYTSILNLLTYVFDIDLLFNYYKDKQIWHNDILGLSIQKFSFLEILYITNDIFNILKTVYPYISNNCNWKKYSNTNNIPSSLLFHTDDIERANAQAGIILKKSPHISDDTLENIIMCENNKTLQWIDDLEIQHPQIYEFVSNYVINDPITFYSNSSYDQNQELNAKRFEYHSEKLKKRNIRQTSNIVKEPQKKKRKLNNYPYYH